MEMITKFYAESVMQGQRTIEQVPEKLRDKVALKIKELQGKSTKE